MKALTIKQPWASLIAHGLKDIENRTWPTKYRGRIYIHAGSGNDWGKNGLTNTQLSICHVAYSNGNLPSTNKLPYSEIIGEVDIIDCVINHSSVWAEKSKEGEKPIYNWVLANAVLYAKPILNIKGKLSFWNYE